MKSLKIQKDPERGVFHKGEHKVVFAYSSNTACDSNGFVLDFELSPGNIHDSTSFIPLYNKLSSIYSNTMNYVLDVGYKTPAIAKLLLEDGKNPIYCYI